MKDVVHLLGMSGCNGPIKVIEPRVHSELVIHRVLDLEPQLVAQHRLPTAGIHNHVAVNAERLPSHLEIHARMVVFEVHRRHPDALIDLRAQLVRVLKKEHVELTAIDVESMVEINPILIALAKVDPDIAVRF